MGAQSGDGFGREHAVRTPAVRDDFAVLGQLVEACFELIERDGECAGDVSSVVLDCGADVDDDDIAVARACEEVTAVDRFEVVARLEVVVFELRDLGEPGRGDVAECAEECGDVGAGEPVEDPGPRTPGVDDPGATEGLQVRGRGGDPEAGRARDGVDAALALREQVEDLDPLGMRDGLGDPGELLVERPFHLGWLELHGHVSLFHGTMEECYRRLRRAATRVEVGMDVVSFVDEGLGHSSYLVDLGQGRSLVVDPSRFPTGQLATATEAGSRIAFTADTHTHADYVSGSPELAARGATFLAPRQGRLEVSHHGIDGGDELDLGGLSLRAIPTPGHTPDHLAYLLLDGSTPRALFSGGSLMVGAVGRTDLLGDEHREALARSLFRALRDDVLTLPDDLPVYPTHGAGSFCSAPAAGARTTTIGRERATNPLLQTDDEDAFVSMLLEGLGTFPTYFRGLPERNRRGVRVYGALPNLGRLSVGETVRLMDEGAVVVDARSIDAFAAGHVPGAVSIMLRPVFASWLGWVVRDDVPLVFVLDDDQDRAELVRQALTIGYEHVAGELDGGMRAWVAAGRDVARTALVAPDNIRGCLLDVRQRNEYVAGHVPGALHVELGALADAHFEDGSVTVMCGHGERAATGASLLERVGVRDVSILTGGPDTWSAATGTPLETGT